MDSFTEQLVLSVPVTPGAAVKETEAVGLVPALMAPKVVPPELDDTEAVPVPLMLTVVVGVAALVVKVSVPLVAPVAVGANLTVAVQEAETARTPQVLVCVKPLLMVTAEMVSGLAAVLVSVTV